MPVLALTRMTFRVALSLKVISCLGRTRSFSGIRWIVKGQLLHGRPGANLKRKKIAVPSMANANRESPVLIEVASSVVGDPRKMINLCWPLLNSYIGVCGHVVRSGL